MFQLWNVTKKIIYWDEPANCYEPESHGDVSLTGSDWWRSRLPNEHKSTAQSFPHRDKWGKHDNYEQQLIETQFNFVCDHVKKFPRYQSC